MSKNIRRMEGTSHFYTFAYLRQAAHNSFDTAKTAAEGSNYHRVSAALFASLTIEAHLNHVGERAIPNWNSIEPTIRWGKKLRQVASELGVALDLEKGWGQTAVRLFKFRDKLAHGKTHDNTVSYKHVEGSRKEEKQLDPEWLSQFWNDAAIERVLKDLDTILYTFHEKAGLDCSTLNLIGDAEFEESENVRNGIL